MINFKFNEQQRVVLQNDKKSNFVQRLVNLIISFSNNRLNKKQAIYVLLSVLTVLLIGFYLLIDSNGSKYNNVKIQDYQLSPKFDHEK